MYLLSYFLRIVEINYMLLKTLKHASNRLYRANNNPIYNRFISKNSAYRFIIFAFTL